MKFELRKISKERNEEIKAMSIRNPLPATGYLVHFDQCMENSTVDEKYIIKFLNGNREFANPGDKICFVFIAEKKYFYIFSFLREGEDKVRYFEIDKIMEIEKKDDNDKEKILEYIKDAIIAVNNNHYDLTKHQKIKCRIYYNGEEI